MNFKLLCFSFGIIWHDTLSYFRLLPFANYSPALSCSTMGNVDLLLALEEQDFLILSAPSLLEVLTDITDIAKTVHFF